MMKTNSAPDILFFNCIKKLMTNLFRAFNSLHFSQNNAPGTKFSPITFIMLHKNLRKGFLGSFYEQNLQNKAFSAQSGKRKFLMASLGLFGSLPFFPFLKSVKRNPYFSTVTLIKVPANITPSLEPDLMMGDPSCVKRNQDYWQKFKTIKDDFVESKKLLYMTTVPYKENGLFAVYGYWKSKESYVAFLKSIDINTFEKELLKNKIHILSKLSSRI